MINLLVVDPVHLTGQMLGAVLEGETDIHVVDIAPNIKAAEAAMQQRAADVILISAVSSEQLALQLLKHGAEHWPKAKCLVYGLPDSEGVVLRYIEAGAVGYVLQEESVAELIHNIRAAVEERALISSEVAARLMTRLVELVERLDQLGMDPSEYEELTPREKEVLDLIGEGMRNAQIADALTVEVGTVKNHVHNILDKLNVNSRKDAAMYLALVDELEAAGHKPSENVG